MPPLITREEAIALGEIEDHVLRLRQKLEPDPANPRYFHTMHGSGYKFIPGDSAVAAEK